MPLHLTYFDDGGVLLKGSGILTAADVVAANAIIYASPEKIRSIAYQIGDYSAVEQIDMSSDDVRRLAMADRDAAQINPDMHIAVVGQNELVYGLLRMWQLYAEDTHSDVSVFKDVDEARTWILKKTEKRRA